MKNLDQSIFIEISISYQVLLLHILYIVKRYDRKTGGLADLALASQIEDNNNSVILRVHHDRWKPA
jgi:hypothetical protein